MKHNKIEQATYFDYRRLQEIGMNCYDCTIEDSQKGVVTRFLFKRYFSKRKFMERANRDVKIMCLYENDVIAGFYELENNGGLASLYVHTDYQKKGYGKHLLMHALKLAKVLGIKEVSLDASKFAVDFYKKYGFKQTGAPREVLGIWMVAMKSKID